MPSAPRTVEVYSVRCYSCDVEHEQPAAAVDLAGAIACPACGATALVQWRPEA